MILLMNGKIGLLKEEASGLSAETLDTLRENAPKGGGRSLKGNSTTGKSMKGNPSIASAGRSSGSSSALSVDSSMPPLEPAAILGYGPYWIDHISVLHLSDDERNVDDTGPLTAITHNVGTCRRTNYFCTGTCLNDIEIDILLRHCVIMPNCAQFGHYMHPQFRTLITPPWVRGALEQYMCYLMPFLRDLCLCNPSIYRGGPLLRLTEIHRANTTTLNAFLAQSKRNFAEHYPVETNAWEQLFVQSPSRQYRMDPYTETIRTPVRLAQTNLAEELRAVSNNVNARIYDQKGSLHFVFYMGGYRNPDAAFPAGLNRGNHNNTREVMKAVAQEITYRTDSLLFDWLHSLPSDGLPRRDDFTPGQARRSVSPRLSDATMDIDS